MTERQIVLDVWEGNPDLDTAALAAGGVKGIVVRINDINGGHHLDTQFEHLWELGKAFKTRGIYFVYNPWVTGIENHRWLVNALPADSNCRVLVDLEVRKAGYGAAAYAKEVATFLSLCQKHHQTGIYTGGGYADLLTVWPTGDYWWAMYPYALYPASVERIGWEELGARLDKLGEPVAKTPGPLRMWQCSGDRLILPGMGNHAVDLNVFYGSEDELINWMGGTVGNPGQNGTGNNQGNVATGGIKMATYQNLAHLVGVDKRHSINTSVAKPVGMVITGYDGLNGTDPGDVIDAKFSEHVGKAAALGIPAFAVLRLYMDTLNGWVSDPAWLDEWNSKVLDKMVMINGSQKRQLAGIIIDAREVQLNDGKIITQGNWRRGVEWFFNAAWQKYGIGLYVLMSKESIDAMPPDAQNTAVEYLNHLNALASISVATVVTDGVNIPYPVDGWKPNYSGTNCGRVYLSYYDYAYVMPGISGGAVDLWQYDRPVQGMYDEIGFRGTAPVAPAPVPTPVPTPAPVPTPVPAPTPVTPTTGVDQAADVHGIYLILQWIKALLQKVFNAQ